MKNTKKKILYVITKSNWGGAQRYVFDLATHLDPKIYDVVVALGGNGQLFDELKKRNIRTISIGNLARNISLLTEFRVARELWNIIQSEKPDVLHINSSKAGGLGAFIGRVCRVPHIIFTAHGWAFNEDRPWWQRIIIKKLHWITVLFSHVTIAVSEMTKQQMDWPFVQKKMVVIHNGIGAIQFLPRNTARDFFIAAIPALHSYQKDTWSVTIAELHPIKQHDVCIRALAHTIEKNPALRHIIIGDGELRTSLENLVRELHLTEHVFFAGHVPNASEYLKAFDLFILPSRSEALAYVIIEACQAGLPIIASNVGGVPEIVTHNHDALLFPHGNVEVLVEHISTLLEYTEMRTNLGLRAKERSAEFMLPSMQEKTHALYEAS